MKIAFITYELPPDTPLGGIATYVHQAASMLGQRGHHVEVFAGSSGRTGTFEQAGYRVHRIRGRGAEFVELAGRLFAERHASVMFDVLEGPDINAEASAAIRLVPDVPLVVKLHTPLAILKKINLPDFSPLHRFRIWAGALRRGEDPVWKYRAADDPERLHALQADEIASPSMAISAEVSRLWGLHPDQIALYPLPFEPSSALLQVPAVHADGYVTFVGRLEPRKGVVDLAAAVPRILRRIPAARFRFVGKDMPYNDGSMTDHLRRLMGKAAAAAEFIPQVPAERLPELMAQAAVCVFPSRWESFGFVCVEAMSAARAVVASSAGGMSELLGNGECGVLVRPSSPRQIADAVIALLQDPGRRCELGARARGRVLDTYGFERVAKLQVASYERAIARRRASGARRS